MGYFLFSLSGIIKSFDDWYGKVFILGIVGCLSTPFYLHFKLEYSWIKAAIITFLIANIFGAIMQLIQHFKKP